MLSALGDLDDIEDRDPFLLAGFPPGPVYFQAPDYTHWTVHEIRDPLATTGRALIFVSAGGFRRVREYPDEWRRLGPPALWDLSWNR